MGFQPSSNFPENLSKTKGAAFSAASKELFRDTRSGSGGGNEACGAWLSGKPALVGLSGVGGRNFRRIKEGEVGVLLWCQLSQALYMSLRTAVEG